jgi:hypothetical protein
LNGVGRESVLAVMKRTLAQAKTKAPMVYANAPADNPLDQSPIAAKQARKKPLLDLL